MFFKTIFKHEGVDYFTINNGSILGLSTELLEINAVPYDIGMENLRSLVLSHREPELWVISALILFY